MSMFNIRDPLIRVSSAESVSGEPISNPFNETFEDYKALQKKQSLLSAHL